MPRSCVAVLLLVSMSLQAQTQSDPVAGPPDTLYRMNPLYWQRIDEWRSAHQQTASIVMLGNSITEGGEWTGLLGREDVVNRGIGSDTMLGYLHRLDGVLRLRPRVVFVMGGINDIYAGFSVDRIFSAYTALLDSLRSHGVVPVVQSTLYASPRWRDAAVRNRQVALLNDRLEHRCVSSGIRFLDVNALLAPDGVLEDRFTTDGIHLTRIAYRTWANAILTVLADQGISR